MYNQITVWTASIFASHETSFSLESTHPTHMYPIKWSVSAEPYQMTDPCPSSTDVRYKAAERVTAHGNLIILVHSTDLSESGTQTFHHKTKESTGIFTHQGTHLFKGGIIENPGWLFIAYTADHAYVSHYRIQSVPLRGMVVSTTYTITFVPSSTTIGTLIMHSL